MPVLDVPPAGSETLRNRLTVPAKEKWKGDDKEKEEIKRARPSSQGRTLSFMGNFFHESRKQHQRYANTITGIFYLDGPVDIKICMALLKERLMLFERFRSVIITEGKKKYWQEVDVDLSVHVFETSLPDPCDEDALNKYVGDSFARPLDPDRPQWEIISIPKYEGRQGKSVVVTRISHEIGDGITLVQVLFNLLDTIEPRKPPVPGKHHPTSSILGHGLSDPLEWVARSAMWISGVLYGLFLAVLPSDTKTIVKLSRPQDLSPEKKVAFSRRVPMTKVKEAKKIVDGTVNDVMVAALTGTLRRYLEYKQDPALKNKRILVRGAFPVNLRSGRSDIFKSPEAFGNQFAMLSMKLPVDAKNPYSLLRQSKARCDSIKMGPEAAVALGTAKIATNILPSKVYFNTVLKMLQKFTLMFTNVPGPQQPVSFAGCRVLDMGFFTPALFGLCFSALSYDGHISLGVLTDPNVIPDPQLLANFFEDELESLNKAAIAHAALPQDPQVPLRYSRVPRRALAWLLVFIGIFAITSWFALREIGLYIFAAFYVFLVIIFFRQHPSTGI